MANTHGDRMGRMAQERENGHDGGEDVLRALGARLRALRHQQSLTLREAGEQAGLSASFISMVETGHTEIAISRLVRLTGVYGASVADVLSEAHEPAVEYVPLEAALRVPLPSPSVDLRYLASPSWEMEPFLLRLAPRARLEGLKHPVQEIIHCVEGRPIVIVGGREYALSPADTLLVPESVEHAYRNDITEDAVLFGVVRRNTNNGVPLLTGLVRAHGKHS